MVILEIVGFVVLLMLLLRTIMWYSGAVDRTAERLVVELLLKNMVLKPTIGPTDSLLVASWVLKGYEKNPVITFAEGKYTWGKLEEWNSSTVLYLYEHGMFVPAIQAELEEDTLTNPDVGC